MTTSSGVNLIPAERLQTRRGSARVTMWVWVILVCGGLLGVAYGVQVAAGSNGGAAVDSAMDEVHAKLAAEEKRLAEQATRKRNQDAMYQANRAVGEQPDWSKLMALVTDRLGDDAALTSCALEPEVPEAVAKVGAKPATSSGSLSTKSLGGRPGKFHFQIKGIAQSQAAVSRFVLAMEQSSAFDKVTLVETQRGTALKDAGAVEKDGVSFVVVCDMTDSGAAGGGQK